MTVKLISSPGVHDDRVGATRTGPYRLLVWHTTEGGEGELKAEQIVATCQTPGDRTTDSGSVFGSSYHGALDTDCVRLIVPFNKVAYSAPGANNDGLHFVFPGRVAQTREQWLEPISTGLAITQAAELAVHLERTEGIPAVRLTDAEILAGKRGYCDHHAITRVYKRSTHTDVGETFPWDELAARIAAVKQPAPPTPKPQPPEDDPVYFTLKSQPATCFQEIAPMVGVRVEPETFQARAIDPSTVKVLPADLAAKYVFLPGFPAGSVK